jgi:anhydro-N-acetylmuramic acid kinase
MIDGAKLALGLMSGTSLDGVDAALLLTDGESAGQAGEALTVPYPDQLRHRLRSVLGGLGPVQEVERDITLFHAEVVQKLLGNAGRPQVEIVGFHGHTVLHQPQQGRTWQIGDGALLASLLGIPVINDFRSADVAAGGQGAPLLPAFHGALAQAVERPLAILNIGGVANVTWIGGDGTLLAFDTGPGNAMIDDWVLRHSGAHYDEGGKVAASGEANLETVNRFLNHAYFDRKPPKSLDRDDFQQHAAGLVEGLALANGAATLSAFTISAIEQAARWFPQPAQAWLVCGGGRHNAALMQGLRRALGVSVEPVEKFGWSGDMIEAQGFAYLAVRSLKGLPLSWPGTTGVPQAMTGGRLHRPPS